MKFCESCGAKIEVSPVCPKCGAALGPNAKFCESCGMPTGSAAPADAAKSAAPAAPPGSGTTPAEAAKSPAEPVVKAEEPVKSKEKAVPLPGEKTAQPVSPVKSVEKTVPVPAPVKEPKKPEIAKEVPKETSQKKPVSSTTVIIAGIIVLALLGAAVFFVVLPMLSGSGTPSSAQQPQTTSGPGSSSVAPATTGAIPQAGSVSLTPGPTDVPPNNRALIIDVEKNAISRDIIVTFQGGEGQYGVRELVITLTRSDGTVVTESLSKLERGSTKTLKGTDKADRVQVTANFYNGETYRIVDKVFEYKKRVGSS
jgi:hypothetical protein